MKQDRENPGEQQHINWGGRDQKHVAGERQL